MIAPLFLNFEQFCRIHGVPDPGAEHGHLSPSGHTSLRTRYALALRLQEQFTERRIGEQTYQALLDQGVLVDPTGRYHGWSWEEEHARRKVNAHALISRAEQLERFAFNGFKPRTHRAQASLYRDKAAAILKGE